MEIDKIQNIVIEFELPYALDIKNSFNNGKLGYTFKIDNIVGQIRAERIFKETKNGIIIGKGKIKNDRLGLISTSKIQIRFDTQLINSGLIEKENIGINTNEIALIGLKYLNKLIKEYKKVTQEYWLFPIKSCYIKEYNFYFLDIDSQIISNGVRLFSFTGSVSFNGKKDIYIGKKKDDIIKHNIERNDSDLAKELRLSIKNQFDLMEYNMVIIQCSILFENFIYIKIKSKTSNTQINNFEHKENCGCFIGIYGICTTGFKKLGFNLENKKIFQDFHKNVLQLRNDLVHGKTIYNTTELSAKTAIELTEKIIKYINKKL